MLITDEYRKLNEKLHETNKGYGTSGHKWAQTIAGFAKMVGTTDVLDYGCGKSTLAQNLPFTINQYDPAVAKYSADPEPADILVCTDVLEHIEPDLIDNVLEHIYNKTKKACFLVIANRPAKKTLEDGRNAHLIQKDEEWWLSKLFPMFNLLQFSSNGVAPDSEYLIMATPKINVKENLNV
jgi:hypothetical protein